MKRNTFVVAVVAAALVLGGGTAASAVSQIRGSQILDQTLTMADIGPGAVNSSEIRENAVTTSDVKDNTLTLADINDTTEQALAGQDGSDGIVEPIVLETEFVNISKVGGKFADNATLAGTITLPAGKYLFTTDAIFHSNAQTSGNTNLQAAIRTPGTEANPWGADLGTVLTSGSPVQKDREITGTSVRVETLTEETVVSVYLFGYDSTGQGSADSGLFDGKVHLIATPVQ